MVKGFYLYCLLSQSLWFDLWFDQRTSQSLLLTRKEFCMSLCPTSRCQDSGLINLESSVAPDLPMPWTVLLSPALLGLFFFVFPPRNTVHIEASFFLETMLRVSAFGFCFVRALCSLTYFCLSLPNTKWNQAYPIGHNLQSKNREWGRQTDRDRARETKREQFG